MKTTKWYQSSGPEGDTVLSTRIRFARNLAHTPFPASMTAQQRRETIDTVRGAVKALGEKNYDYLDMTALPPYTASALMERHLISPEFAACEEGSGLLLSKDEGISIMLNEEDHLRLQVMRAGLRLDEAFEVADELDTRLDKELHFAFDDRLGYLTQCPTNLGTGMRASLMLHLPLLQDRGAIQQLANTVNKLGLAIRGMYGEGSKPEGAIYQLSNQVTLGISEKAAIENLKGIATQVIKEERAAREQLRDNPHFEDRVWRSYGLLKTARLLTSDEFMNLMSTLRVGISLGLVDTVGLDDISELMIDVQPANLMLKAGRELDPTQRDTLRAEVVRERLGKS